MKNILSIFTFSFLTFFSSNSFAYGDAEFLAIGISSNNFSANNSSIHSIHGFGANPNTENDANTIGLDSSNNSFVLEFSRSLTFNKFKIFNKELADTFLRDSFVKFDFFYDNLDFNSLSSINVNVNNRDITGTFNTTIDSRYGAKISIGKNLVNNLSFYAGFGLASLDYEIDNRFTNEFFVENSTSNGRVIDSIYLVGFAYEINKDLFLDLSYSKQQSTLESRSLFTTNTLNVGGLMINRIPVEIETINLKAVSRF
tara:strand:- start:3743 stop:4510 length:768 start_codon:yes stop_codon:yes gene_type:complete